MKTPIATRILEAAVALFAESGYAGVSLTNLERKAKVTRTSIYQQFGSKERLFEEALALAMGKLLDPGEFVITIFENRKKQTLPVLLTSAVERWYAAMPRETACLLVYSCLSGNRKWREMALAPVERIIQLLAIGMEREIRKKSSFRPMTAAKAVILALLQYKVLLAAEKPGKEETAEVRGMIEQWVKGLGAAT